MPPAPNVIIRWNDTILAILEIATNDRDLRLGPPMVARALAMIHMAGFQAWAAYDNTATAPVPGGPPRQAAALRTGENRRIAVSHAIFRTALNLFPKPGLVDLLEARMRDLGLDPKDTTTTGDSPAAVGNAVAAAVIAARANDGANQSGTDAGSPPVPPGGQPVPYADTIGYAPVNRPALAFGSTSRRNIADPTRWQPLSYIDPNDEVVATPGFIAPHWKKVAPFALTGADQFRPRAPEPIDSQGFLDQARYVVEVQKNLTIEQKIIAEYWADGPRSWLPPGHWCEIAGEVSRARGHSLEQDAKLFFALTGAIHDAAIATWEAKLHYDYARPITAIRWLFAGFRLEAWMGPGLGNGVVMGERWRPFQRDTFPTPPFPEYTSGHSAFSMAGAVVLKAFTGSDRFRLTHVQSVPLAAEPVLAGLPVTLTWESFTEAAISAGESRLFGGIHFHQGNVAGLELGRKVGEAAWAKAQTFF